MSSAAAAPTPMPASFLGSAANPSSSPFTETGFASTGFLIMSSALVFIMTPGVGLLYSGLSRSKNALTIIMLSYLSYAIVAIQWVIFGFSLAFSETGGLFIGDFNYAGLSNIGANAMLNTASTIPSIVFSLYQLQFATVTVAIIFGAVTERVRLLPAMVFIFVWTTLIYDPVAYWTWGSRGWLRNLSCLNTIVVSSDLSNIPCGIGSIDFAGGGPVHQASGFAGLAYSLVLGKRRSNGQDLHKPHNLTNVFLGTALLWFGWFGFNGGSAVAATPRAGMAAFVTTIAACAGGLSWVLIDAIRTKKVSGVGFCSGVLAGLVGITPASGYVAPWAAIVIGAVTAAACNASCLLKEVMGVDDSLDAWALHGVGGFVGNFLAGVFAQKWIAQLDGTSIPGGAIDGNPMQIGYQLAGAVAISAYSFVGSYIILAIMNKIPGLHLRVSPEDEIKGGDLGEMGEVAYELVETSLPDMKHSAKESGLTLA
ncbi:ammonium transporter AmtB-like domain-containing protein [Gorgonomyces haynaldii]|nr:ammonium transporter AmtB-like domain-containing protein [Gorgonomyces haynaldii]